MSTDIYIGLITINTLQLAPINSASKLTKSRQGILSELFKHTQADRATVPRSGKESTMESAAQPLSCKAHIYSQALPSVTSSAQLLIWVDDNAVNAHSVLHVSAELFPAPPSLLSTSDKHRERVMGTLHTLKHPKAGGRASHGRSFLGVFLSKLCRKEDWREDHGDLKSYASLSSCTKTLFICSLLLHRSRVCCCQSRTFA